MTTKDAKKFLTQLNHKPHKLIRFKKYNLPNERSCGQNLFKCNKCGRTGGHINKYGLHLCRHCFRENARDIGFKQYS